MSEEIYDLRQHDDDSGGASTSSTSSPSTTSTMLAGGAGGTIVSSAPSSSWSPSSSSSLYDGDAAVPTTANNNSSSVALSLNPSMVDSSVLPTPTSASTTSAQNNTNRVNDNWMIELIRAIPSHNACSSLASASDISSDDIASVISSCCDDNASYSTLCAPDVFGNIGRSLIFASAASMGSSSTVGNENSSFGVVESGMETKWWDRLQTDEDWDVFRKKANEYMNALIVEEMKGLSGSRVCSDDFDCKMDKTVVVKRDQHQLQRKQVTAKQGFLLWWLDGICKSIHATIARITSNEDSAPSKYVSALVKEIVDIQQQLERLPPMPPALPAELSLDDLPPESREMLSQYRDRLDAWRRGVMPHQEELSMRYARCQEKLLAAIVDTEQKLFYDCEVEGRDTLGAMNDDGYIEVVEKESSLWGVLINESMMTSRGKCQFATFSAALVAALTAGAGLFLTLQTKRSK